MSRYECRLSPELLKKAVDELNEPEDNDVRLSAIDELRTRFETQAKDLTLIRTDDAFLLRFLRVRKFNQDRAYEVLLNYHKQREDWKELFALVDNPESCKELCLGGSLLHIKNCRARDGSFVINGRPGLGFKGKKDMLKFIALVIMSVEKLLEQEEFQICGLTAVQDMAYCGMSQAMPMMSHGRKFLFVMQEALPVRVKGLNLLNETFIFDMIYAITSKFLKEKLKKRLHIHGTNMESLHDEIDPVNLPPIYKGTGPDPDSAWWAGQLINQKNM